MNTRLYTIIVHEFDIFISVTIMADKNMTHYVTVFTYGCNFISRFIYDYKFFYFCIITDDYS